MSSTHSNAHRHQNMAKVTLKNNSSKYTLTIPTHQGTMTIKPYASETLNLQRGQSYDVTIYAKNGAILGSTSEKFTAGKYEVNIESNLESSDPDAVNITVIKPSLKSSSYY